MGDRRAPPQRLSDPIDQVLGPTGLLSQQLSHYEPRPAQLTMARQVMEALENGDKLIVEAGTGTGKTLAYLVPAVLSGMKTVISTGTKTLQDQVYERELPRLLDLVGKDRRSTCCMKGIGNFLCLRRLNEVRRAPSLFADPLLEPLLRWAETTETGDRAELSALPDGHPLWNEVSPTPETRIGPRCSFFESCFVTRMRRQAAAADVIVVNHHLLLADLVLRQTAPGAGVIPAFESLIIDEAHQLEAIATASFGQMVSGQSLGTLARDGSRAASVCRDEALERLARRLAESSADLFHSVARELLSGARLETAREDLADAGPSAARLRLTEPPLDGQLRQPYFNVDASLEALEEHLSLRAGEEELGQLALRAQRAREALALFAEPPSRGFIFWAERVRGGGLALHASPVEVGPLLQSSVLGEPLPVVLTSATLSTGRCFARPGRPGEERDSVDLPFCERSDRRATAAASSPSRSLAYYRQRIGLESAPEVQELILPSPFRYETQVLLYLPRDLPQPSQPEFVMRAAERMTQLIDITGGRALVLFTSHRNLQAARPLISSQLDYTVLCQGDQPRSMLLDRFRREVSSVLLATASFWEGVDVVGESLSLVIMDKLPFAVPSDPLTAARMDLAKERGEDPFTSYQLPQAALSLRQGFGRLVRHRADRGIVAILDRRLHERAYGRSLLESLPPCPRTSDLLRVRAFSKEMLELR